MIRDGRNVVRSMMSRRTFTWRDPITQAIHPKCQDPYFEKWSSMNRFEKICWYWRVENEYLRTHTIKTIRFEKIIDDYEYFIVNLSKSLDLDIPEYVWRNSINRPRNITQKYKFPHWTEWDFGIKNTFKKICGDEMLINGYKL
jgi:hypothetical protein